MKTSPQAASLRRRAPGLLFAGLCLFGLFFAIRMFDFGFNPGDEGVAVMGAWRILEGQVPHRDFFEIIPPFSFLPTALAFKLLGVGLTAERVVVWLYAVLLALGAERLLSRYTPSLLARGACVAVLIPFGVYHWPMPSHHWLVDILQLFALLALLRGLEEGRPAAWGLVAGALTGLACFSLQDQGAYLVMALPLLFFPWIGDAGVRKRLAVGWAAGGLATGAAFAAYLLPHVAPSELIRQWVSFPLERYKLLPGNVGGFARGLELIGSERWRGMVESFPLYTLSWTLLACLLIVLPLAAVLALAIAAARRWDRPERIGLLAAGTVAFVGACLHRYALQNVVWALPLPLVVVLWALARGRKAGRRWARVAISVAGMVLVLASVTYAQRLLSLSSPDRTMAVNGRGGGLRFYRQPHTGGTQLILSTLERLVPPGAPLFCTGFNPLINFWTLSPNPTRYNFFVRPEYHTDEQEKEIVGALRREPRTHVLLLPPTEVDGELGILLESRYRSVWRTPFAELLAPRPDFEG